MNERKRKPWFVFWFVVAALTYYPYLLLFVLSRWFFVFDFWLWDNRPGKYSPENRDRRD